VIGTWVDFMGKIVSIVHTPPGIDPRPPDHYARVPLKVATLEAGRGIVTDRKGSNAQRLRLYYKKSGGSTAPDSPSTPDAGRVPPFGIPAHLSAPAREAVRGGAARGEPGRSG
jgi:hypothetical protein